MFSIENLPISIIEVNKDFKIIMANKMAHDLFGYEPEELIGKHLDILVPPESREKHNALAKEYWENEYCPKKLGVGRDMMGAHKNGTFIPVEIGLYPKNGNVIAFIVDITIRKTIKLNDQLKFLAKSLSDTLKNFGEIIDEAH